MMGRPPEQRREELHDRLSKTEKEIIGPRQGPGGGSAPQRTKQEFWRGEITAVALNSGRPLYTAVALDDPEIIVDRRRPKWSPTTAEVLMKAAKVGARCIIAEDGDNGYDILAADGETIDTAACEAGLGFGTTNSDPGVSILEGIARGLGGPIYPSVRNLHQTITFTVVSGTTQQYGAKIYTLEDAVWAIQSAYYFAKFSSASITRNIRFALATTDATGSTGTNFSSANENLVENLQSVSLGSGSAEYTRFSPHSANTVNDITNLYPILDALASDVDIFLNICQTAAGGWNASDDITVDLQVALDLKNLGAFV